MTPLQDKLDDILKRLWDNGFDKAQQNYTPGYKTYTKEEATQSILTALEAWVTSAMPEKLQATSYKHRGFMDLTETSLMEATENVKRSGYNQALDQYHTKLMEELKP